MPAELERARARLTEALSRDRSGLTRFARSRLGDHAHPDAEDVVADVVLHLFERADLLAQVENLTAYLFRAVGNALADRFRRWRPSESVPADPVLAERPDPGPTPEESLAQVQLRRRLDGALNRLSAPERAVWLAVEVEGLSFRQLAQAWDEPIGTLLSRKTRAARTLRKLLAADEPEKDTTPP